MDQPVLPVPDDIDEEALARLMTGAAPTTAEEYLLKVRLEAQAIPKVLTSSVDPRQFDKEQTVYAPPAENISSTATDLLPDEEWEAEVLCDFAILRQGLSRWVKLAPIPKEERFPVPLMKDMEGWRSFCLGTKEQDTEDKELPPPAPADLRKDEPLRGETPRVRLLLQFDQLLTRTLLGYHIEWAVESPWTRNGALWIYALLSRIDMPIFPDTAASLRKLLRKCLALRSQNSRLDPNLVSLNLLICIVGKFFGQESDL